ncbi:hypothetical protein RB195_021854 [Necator americanus]|uniref:MEIS N-terminal domain-containing protein n=1 Tax=Necator americanus TaxID=51031 RepID=A0ABR1EDY6_NECAM
MSYTITTISGRWLSMLDFLVTRKRLTLRPCYPLTPGANGCHRRKVNRVLVTRKSICADDNHKASSRLFSLKLAPNLEVLLEKRDDFKEHMSSKPGTSSQTTCADEEKKSRLLHEALTKASAVRASKRMQFPLQHVAKGYHRRETPKLVSDAFLEQLPLVSEKSWMYERLCHLYNDLQRLAVKAMQSYGTTICLEPESSSTSSQLTDVELIKCHPLMPVLQLLCEKCGDATHTMQPRAFQMNDVCQEKGQDSDDNSESKRC